MIRSILRFIIGLIIAFMLVGVLAMGIWAVHSEMKPHTPTALYNPKTLQP